MAIYGELGSLLEKFSADSAIGVGLAYLSALREWPSGIGEGAPALKVAVDGDRVFALHQSYVTKPAEAARFEAHHRYVDLQYLVLGEELVRVSPLGNEKPGEPYDVERDIAFYPLGEGRELLLKPGLVAILFPEDLHAPCLAVNAPQMVRKIVVKVLVEKFSG